MTGATQTLSPELAQQLAQLRDIHLPSSISWWPPAPGWWVIAGIFVAATIVTTIIFHIRQRTVRYRALRELNELRRDESLEVTTLAERIEVLLKRSMMQTLATKTFGVEHSDRWIDRLTNGPGGMPAEIASFIALAPYSVATRADVLPERKAILAAADRWIRRNA